MYATKSRLKSLLSETSCGSLPPELLPVDRIMQRYWVANGNGVQAAAWDENPRYSKPPPLDDDTATVVDRIFVRLEPRARKLLTDWYGSPLPTYVIAKSLKMSQRTLEQAHAMEMNFMRWRFENSKNPTLLRLLAVRIEA